MPRERLLAIVMHGAGPHYLAPLLAAGRLPNLAALQAAGTSRALISPMPLAAGAWVTMFTGESIGRHGVIDYIQVDARRYHVTTGEIVPATTYADRTMFAAMSRHGLKIAVIGLPMTWPAFPVNGLMVSGFPLPDELAPTTWPPELAATLPPMAASRVSTLRYQDHDGLRAWLQHQVSATIRLAHQCWADDSYDVVFACLAAPDVAHHFFSTPGDPMALERINRVYEGVDTALGALVQQVGPDALCLVYSDHGGGPAPSRAFSVNRWLIERGFLVPKAGQAGALARATNALVQQAKRLRLNQHLAPLIRGPLRDRVSAITHNAAFMDWSRSRAYGMNFFYPLVGIEVNQSGRQAQGTVPPGARSEALIETLRQELCALTDPETGVRVCRNVWSAEERYAGPHLARFPDVIAELHPDYDARTPLMDTVFAPNDLQWEYPYLGYHHPYGVFCARGPGVPAGIEAGEMRMMDLAPTLLSWLGVPVPSSMEGRAMGRA